MPQPSASRLPVPRSPTLLRELRRVTGVALAEVGALAFPVPCVGCGEPPVMLCTLCQRELRPAPSMRVLESGLRVWSGLPFQGVAARAIRALKAELRTPLARHLAPALAGALDAAWDAAPTSLRNGRPRVVVTVPTSAASWRRRGVRVVDLLARRAGARPARVLHPARNIADQRGLGRADRGNNVAHSMRCDDVRGLEIILIDDVVTSGATLAEATRAVVSAGGTVFGAVTVATTPLVFGAAGIHA